MNSKETQTITSIDPNSTSIWISAKGRSINKLADDFTSLMMTLQATYNSIHSSEKTTYLRRIKQMVNEESRNYRIMCTHEYTVEESVRHQQ